MRKIVTGVAFLLSITGAGLAQGQPTGDQKVFKDLIQQYWKAWSTLNPDNAASMYSKDADAVFYDVAPLKYNGWEEYKQGILKAFSGATATITPNDDLKVTRRGNIAWTSETFHGVVNQKDGSHMDLTGRHTTIWEKRGGHWIIVHEHVSAPLAG
jgi:ketosteroid isomerase-like protein